ncbi:MAG: FkbM family methyltransferase [Candidatus Micrarchaeaceae archaeon]
MILRRLFSGKRSGFYVDVGAHHPRRFSNTNFFYKRGWRGINIEPSPEGANIFRRQRRRDINLQAGVAEHPGLVTYYCMDDSALNTFDAELLRQRLDTTGYRLVDQLEIKVDRLADILKRHMPPAQKIDFISIDVEGFDLQVLKSNDWKVFRPLCVLVETHCGSLDSVLRGDVYKFMRERDYELYSKTVNTLIFRVTERSELR